MIEPTNAPSTPMDKPIINQINACQLMLSTAYLTNDSNEDSEDGCADQATEYECDRRCHAWPSVCRSSSTISILTARCPGSYSSIQNRPMSFFL